MRAAQEVRLFPAPGTLPSTPSGQRPPGERPSLAGAATQRRPRDSGRSPPQPGVRSLLAVSRPSNAVLPSHRQSPHKSGTENEGPRKLGTLAWARSLAPRLSDLIFKGRVAMCSRGHRGGGGTGDL